MMANIISVFPTCQLLLLLLLCLAVALKLLPLSLLPQFWNIPFWRCSVGVCSDSSVDDVGFIDQVLQDMPRRLQVKSKQVSPLHPSC